MDHILIFGSFANHIWKVHAPKVGTNHCYTNLRSLLILWRILQYHNEVQIFLFVFTQV